MAQSVAVVKRPGEKVSGPAALESPKERAIAVVLNTLGDADHSRAEFTQPTPPATTKTVSDRVQRQADDLTIDLLTTTLIDPMPLWLVALERTTNPDEASSATRDQSAKADLRDLADQVGWMPGPPWPPETIARMLANPDSRPALEVWLRRITPDDRAGAWLLASWQRPARLVDRALLEEIAAARDGALVEDCRFRAWLRAEWSSWAVRRARGGSR